jgi:hypothetical protein
MIPADVTWRGGLATEDETNPRPLLTLGLACQPYDNTTGDADPAAQSPGLGAPTKSEVNFSHCREVVSGFGSFEPQQSQGRPGVSRFRRSSP